jgi:hypothetical protein
LLTGLHIASYVITDSGPDCNSAEEPQMQPVKAALNSVQTTFPKYYFSKKNMVYQQWQLTTKCITFQGHTMEPMNIVFWNRYFNLVCNSPQQDFTYDDTIPVCVDLGDYTNTNNRCFGTGPNGQWMDNIMQVCLLDHLNVANEPPCAVRVAAGQAHRQNKRRLCKVHHVRVVDTGNAHTTVT